MRFSLLLILIVLPLPAEGAQEWVEEFQQPPFQFRSEFPIRQAPLMRDLVQLRRELRETLGLRIGDAPIRVSFFADRRSYLNYMREHVPEGASRKALFVKGPNSSHVYAYRSTTFDTDVRHECTHALVHNALPFIPLWMDEGLAEYFEAPAGARVRPAKLKDMRHSVRWARLLGFRGSLSDLEALDEIRQMGAAEYKYSWAWVHFLLHDSPESKQALIGYIDRIQKGNPPGAFSAWAAARLPDPDTKLIQHFRYFR